LPQQVRKGVVLCQHGLNDNANGWVMNEPTESLAFVLADNGYEVWLGNNRGNGYSMKNTKYTTDQAEFWDFSFDQMASSDLPTQINFVLKKTGVQQVSYIGHSEGTIQAFAGLLEPAVARKVNLFIALAPVAYVHHIRAGLFRVLSFLDAAELLELLGDHEFFLPDVVHKLLPDPCRLFPSACNFFLEFITGPSEHINASRLSYYLLYEPNPTSVVNMIHWSQLVNVNKFQKFDFGHAGNMKHYNRSTPPQYNLAHLKVPLALFTGSNDYLGDQTDLQQLISQLSVPPVLHHNEPTYAHLDPLWAPDAHVKIYPTLLQLLDKYNLR